MSSGEASCAFRKSELVTHRRVSAENRVVIIHDSSEYPAMMNASSKKEPMENAAPMYVRATIKMKQSSSHHRLPAPPHSDVGTFLRISHPNSSCGFSGSIPRAFRYARTSFCKPTMMRMGSSSSSDRSRCAVRIISAHFIVWACQ